MHPEVNWWLGKKEGVCQDVFFVILLYNPSFHFILGNGKVRSTPKYDLMPSDATQQ